MRAVRFSEYGSVDVLEVADVDEPIPGPGEVLVQVLAAGINPGESGIREGAFRDTFPARFPEGQGSDFAGLVRLPGVGVSRWHEDDEVIGYTSRQSHAEYVVVPESQLVSKPEKLEWELAGSLYVTGTTAWAAIDAVGVKEGDVVVISAAAGGVGVWASQLALRRGATVIGTASEGSFDFLRSIGVRPVEYGDGLAHRLREAALNGIDAYLDNHGDGNVQTALVLGVPADRINTTTDFAAVRDFDVKSAGNAEGTSNEVLEELAELLSSNSVMIPLSAIYPLEKVRDAYRELEQGHTRGKIVLGMRPIDHLNTAHKGAPQIV